MRVLVVDDEVLCAEGICYAIDWKQIGVDDVVTAYSMSQAITALEKMPVDIMITDVEMPKGSGFDLLEWMSKSAYHPIVIMLTSYATFEYAKKAINYQVFDYILKPVSQGTLLDVASRCVTEVKLQQGNREKSQKALYWDLQERQRIRHFWRTIIESSKHWNSESINEYARSEHITFDDQQLYMPIIFKIQNISESLTWETLTPRIKIAIIEEIPEIKEKIVWMYNQERLLAIVQNIEICEELRGKIHQFAYQFIRQMSTENIRMSLYMGQFKDSWMVTEQYVALRTLDENNVTQNIGIFEENLTQNNIDYTRPDIEKWMEEFLNGNVDEAIKMIEKDLDLLSHEKRLNKENLSKLLQDFMQTFYIVMGEKEIQANLLLEDKVSDDYYKKAATSVNNFKIWVCHILEKANLQLNKISDENSILTEIRHFIKTHLDQELSRKQIAEHVCMSQDYVSRIYRQATGMQLSEYITQVRMEEARCLLKTTTDPIGEIAYKVGYFNVAYFSRVFRIRNGETPQEYRAKSK